MLTYLPPVVLTAVGVASAKRWHSPYLVAALAFAAAGFNESFTAMLGTGLLLAILLLPRMAQSPVRLERESYPFAQVWSMKPDPAWPINRCVAAYYDVDAVSTPAP